jgi:hypothetical protein
MNSRFSPAAFRLYFAVLGFLLAAAAVALDNRYLGWAALSVLTVALILRLYLSRKHR